MRRHASDFNREGEVFGIPLTEGRFALGVVARGRILTSDGYGEMLCYFFGPHLDSLPEVPSDLRSEDTVLIKVFDNQAIEAGTWPLLGPHPHFNREDWPTPDFCRRDDVNQRFYRVRLHPDDPSRTLKEWKITAGEAASLPTGGGVAFSAGGNSFLSLLLQDEPLHQRYVGVIEAQALDWAGIVTKAKRLNNVLVADPYAMGIDSSSNSDPASEEHSLILHLPLISAEPEVAGVPLNVLEQRLSDAIDQNNAGEFEGDLLGPDDATLYMYGPDADRLFAAIEPVLKRLRFPKGSYAVKRYGDPGDPDVKETRVELVV